jgi:sugar/nucleoside kinase (ribokinase family)
MDGPLVIVGDVVTDIVCRTNGPWRSGTDVPASVAIRPGGSAANTAAWAGVAGTHVVLVGRVGADDVAWHVDHLREHGVDPRLVVDDSAVTTRLVALIDHSGDRTMLTDRGANLHLCTDDLRVLVGLPPPQWFHLSGYLLFAPSPQLVFAEVKRWCAANGIGWSVDPASVGFLSELGRDTARELLSGAWIGFPNEDEARWLAGLDDNATMAEVAVALRSLWNTVVVTCGGQGVVVSHGDDPSTVTSAPALIDASVVDAVGAGDAFAGAWLAAHLAAQPMELCIDRALAAASMALQQEGGRPAPR